MEMMARKELKLSQALINNINQSGNFRGRVPRYNVLCFSKCSFLRTSYYQDSPLNTCMSEVSGGIHNALMLSFYCLPMYVFLTRCLSACVELPDKEGAGSSQKLLHLLERHGPRSLSVCQL